MTWSYRIVKTSKLHINDTILSFHKDRFWQYLYCKKILHILYDISFVCPGFTILITPPNAHIHIADKVTDGIFLNINFGLGGVHGATVIGVHGIGAPNAAATAGFAGDVHIPKGNIFTKGANSVMSKTVIFSALIILAGKTMSVPGASPKEHFIIVLMHGVGDGILFMSFLLCSNFTRNFIFFIYLRTSVIFFV